jgi:Fe-S-cluster containining protein
MIVSKVEEIKSILEEVETRTNDFGRKNGITCPAGCGNCCITPNIEASPLEFLPAAYNLYINGKAEQALELVKNKPLKSICIFYNSEPGVTERCTMYPNRGLVCRLFGYSTRINKMNEYSMITCPIIKQSEPYTRLGQPELRVAPLASGCYMQLRNIDIREGDRMMPVNEAIRNALEMVLLYFSYESE